MIRPPLNSVEVSSELIDALRTFSAEREVEHYGVRFTTSSFDFHGTCPQCGKRIKLRGFSAHPELADLFDAFFEWVNRPENAEVALRRQKALKEEVD